MRVGFASDHGGFGLKSDFLKRLGELGYELLDYGAYEYDASDDFPDFVHPLAVALREGEVERAIAICGSGIGACIVANKVRGVRAALVGDSFSAHQGVEHDDMNFICIGARVVGRELAYELVSVFLQARFISSGRFLRRVKKIDNLDLGLR
ncbi:RpiB/LacA/LacB family sugar-phosphate isomerase [Chitinispirillales bacterium ANBcel5]|uniref:RpiB/LacA/LacB family sugar-phosphate isomerase n=1 Tax=Cellulosispirillum alkaliphilum TaxID=3039283 RepID=UPI002A4F8660|nr:RpiB/LacA/LacB family sugar-phosphate isomerase [Chitinispirillales bacterium ANBcel5]